MPSKQTMAKISGLIKAKRRERGIGLRDAAKESGVSASTLSRLERGISTKMPDTETLSRLCHWLGISISDLINEKKIGGNVNTPNFDTTEQVEVYLRADKNLSHDSAQALAQAFKVLYKQFTSVPTDKRTTAKRKKK
jgi:transcriptional regulator with XRE-family HTH domain